MAKPLRPPRPLKRATDTKDSSVRGRATKPPRLSQGVPELFADPLPELVEPCLATLRSDVPSGDKWLHEIKWDGYRLMIRVEDGQVTILTRRGHDWTDRFPTIRDAAMALPVRNAILDGEAVVEVNGIADFSALQAALGARDGPGHKAAHEAVFYAFDLLHLNAIDLTPAPLLDRKAALKELVGNLDGAILYSEHLQEDGESLFKQACLMGLEGIISKRSDRPYRSGRYDDWFKIKCVHRSLRLRSSRALGWREQVPEPADRGRRPAMLRSAARSSTLWRKRRSWSRAGEGTSTLCDRILPL